LFVSAGISAQTDVGGKKTIVVPKIKKPKPATPPANEAPTTLFTAPEPKPINRPEPEPLNSGFAKAPPQFANPNAEVLEKLRKQEYRPEHMRDQRENQYLGEIRTKSKIGRIVYRDFDEIDGDVIMIYIDGIQTRSETYLDATLQGFAITFKEGTNTIQFESLDEGLGPPNTAEVQVLDEQGNVIFASRWAILNGFRATIDIIKEHETTQPEPEPAKEPDAKE
jgi:hypothetical protein